MEPNQFDDLKEQYRQLEEDIDDVLYSFETKDEKLGGESVCRSDFEALEREFLLIPANEKNNPSYRELENQRNKTAKKIEKLTRS